VRRLDHGGGDERTLRLSPEAIGPKIPRDIGAPRGKVAAVVDDENDPGGAERRRKPRAPIDLDVSLRFSSVQHFLSAHAGDISESGMFIAGWSPEADTAPHEIGQIVQLRFDAGKERIVQGTARIARVEKGGIGLQFVELDETSRKLIEMIVRIQLAAG
jgi:hypothetical protein